MDRDIKPSFRDSFTVMAFDSISLCVENTREEIAGKVHLYYKTDTLDYPTICHSQF